MQHNIDDVLANRLEEAVLPDEGQAFARELAHGTLEYQAVVDDLIQRAAPQWPLAQIAKVDVNILRLAVYELVHGHVTAKVVINEAVELAKTFGGDSSPRFINGVLGTVAQHVPQST